MVFSGMSPSLISSMDSRTAASNTSFLFAISYTFSSTVPLVTSLQWKMSQEKSHQDTQTVSNYKAWTLTKKNTGFSTFTNVNGSEGKITGKYRYMVTGFVWPIRWQRSSACLSICGLKSMSWITTVSAPVKFKPWPPALVESKHANIEVSLLNVSTIVCLSATCVLAIK